MRIQYLLFVCCLLFLISGLRAQMPGPSRCGFDEVRRYNQQTEAWKRREADIEQKIQQWLLNKRGSSDAQRYFPNGPEYIIPVVVHVIHNGETVGSGTNISFAQIQSQLDALNAAFSKYSSTANYYQSLAAAQFATVIPGVHAVDTKIRFCLATNTGSAVSWTSPAEPGVMRYNNPGASRHAYTTADQTEIANLTQAGGAFPSDRFLNIWVVTAIRFGGPENGGDCPGIQGYASIAGYNGPMLRILEGVVMRSDVFGDNFISGNNFNLQPNANPACPGGNNNNLANRGKILAHEVGHYLGLYHTFEDCQGSIAAQCNSTGDLICDTNPCDQPAAPVGCGVSDMPENFMYYADDATLNTFTPDQRDRMYAMINAYRSTLVSETNVLASGVLGPTGCFAGTVLADFTFPSTLCVNTATSFANVSGSGNLANQWQWTVTPASGVTISAPNAATTNITFTNSGSYTIQLTASNNGSSLRIVDTVVQVLACSLLDCRRDNQQWIFGWGQQGVDFSSGSPRAFVPPAALFNDNNQESYITRTDANGQILYFTNGSFVYDGNFNKLNATSFHPLASSGAIYNSSAQIISLPFPGHPGEYLMFVPNKGWDSPPLTAVAANYPPHTIVDINMNGTPSATPFSCNTLVVPPAGETFSFNQFAYSEQITAIPHANGRDYWIVFPVASVSAKLYLVSFLLSPAGLKQQAIQQIESSALIMSVGYGLAVSPSHNRLAFKYMNFALEIQLATLAFNNRTGSFGAPVKYSLNAYNIPQPGGIVFYDDTHAYLSRTGGTGRGILDLDLLTGVGVDFAAGNEYSRFSIGPDGQIYTIYKAGLFGANSQALARIDRVAGVPTVNIAIPGNQLSGNLTGFQGINFWNLDENVYCRPDTTNIDFSIIRTNCNSYQFVLNDSATWYPYNVIWNFGDGSPSITLPANQPATHSYATPGLYPVSMQVFVTGCLSSNLLPAQPVVHLVEPVDANAPLIIQGPDTICINSQLHDVSYTTAQSAGAQYTWSVVSGDAIVRQPSSGLGIYQAWYSFGQTAGPRTIQVQMTEGSCSVTGTLTVTGTLPGQAHAGQNGSLNICASVQQPIDLFSLITGEDPGGYWIRISGTGGIFNAANATFTPQPGATSSVFQYILSGNTGCTNADTSEASIQILSTNGAGLDGTLSVCQTDYPTIDLFAVITGESAGGVWERVSGTGGVFNSAAGTFAITATATSSLFRYIIIGNNGCPNDSSLATITVNIRVPAGSDGQVNICNLNGPVLTLTDYIPGAFNGGTWVRLSGTGGVFNATAGTFGPVFAIEQSLFEYRTPTNGVCPGDTSRVTVTVGDFNPLPDTDTTQCGNQSLNLQALYDLSGYTIVQPWFYNAAPVANPTAVSQSGLYTTVISNGSNCSDTLNVRLQQSPAAQANAGPDTIAVYGQPLQLQGSGNGNPQWTWSPLNATVSNAQIYQPLVTLTAPEYWFILQVSNANECKAADSVRIKVYRGPTYYVPTVFTPNGDGLNDALVAIPVGIIQTEFFRVYNRFGELIFETRDPRSGWNGRYKGKDQNIGGYTWTIRGLAYNNKIIEMKGTVLLLR